jgi:hypothetical protein
MDESMGERRNLGLDNAFKWVNGGDGGRSRGHGRALGGEMFHWPRQCCHVGEGGDGGRS